MTDAEFQQFLLDHLTVVAAVAHPGAVLMAFIDFRGVEKLILAGKQAGLSLITIAIWNKSNAGMMSPWRSKHEMCVIFKKPGAPISDYVELGKHGRYRTNVWDAPSKSSFGANRMEELSMHPTAKPMSLIAEAILDVTKRGETVFDGFLGSGTTLIACERKGRVCVGIDLDPLYVDTAVRRWERETGKQAVLEGTGRTFAEVEAERASTTIDAACEPQLIPIRARKRPATQAA